MRETGQMRAFLRGERKISHDNRFAIFGFSIAWAAMAIAAALLGDSILKLLFRRLLGISADNMEALMVFLPIPYRVGALFAIPLVGIVILAVSGRTRRWRGLFYSGVVVILLALIALIEVRFDMIRGEKLLVFIASACLLRVVGWVFIVWALTVGGTAWGRERFLE